MMSVKESHIGDVMQSMKMHSATGHIGRAHKDSSTGMESHRPTGPHKKGLCLFYSPHISSVSDTHQVFNNTPENTFLLASVHMHGWVHTHVGQLM